jgi:hypothetical protein
MKWLNSLRELLIMKSPKWLRVSVRQPKRLRLTLRELLLLMLIAATAFGWWEDHYRRLNEYECYRDAEKWKALAERWESRALLMKEAINLEGSFRRVPTHVEWDQYEQIEFDYSPRAKN